MIINTCSSKIHRIKLFVIDGLILQFNILIYSYDVKQSLSVYVYYYYYLETGYTLLCSQRFRPATSLGMQFRRNISSRFSKNSEAIASKFRENLEEMISRYMNHE